MKKFVIFNKQPGEITNAYSLVTPEILATIPQDIIFKVVDVEDKLYTKDEFISLLNANL
jgi:hypothetical protein